MSYHYEGLVPVLYWRDDVINLTAYISKYKYDEMKPPGPLLKAFQRGSNQINYGYTDKGLNLGDSKDAINFRELGTHLAYICRFSASHALITGELLLSSSGWFGVRYQPRKSPAITNLSQIN